MAENSRFGREPIQVVQIDQDFCSRTYGVLPCQASLSENLLLWTSDFSNSYWDKSDCAIVGSEGIGGFTYTIFDINDVFDSGFIASPNSGAPIGTAEIGLRYTMRVNMKRKPTDDHEMTFQFVLSLSDGSTDENALIFANVGANSGSVISDSIVADPAFNASYTISVLADTIEFEASLDLYHPSGFIQSGLFQATAGGGNPLNLPDDTFSIGKFTVFSGSLSQEFIETEGEIRQRTGTDKCFNTRSTCQDPANYDKTTLPLKFVNKQAVLPKDDYYIPSLTSVKVTPARLNPGGANRNAGALGERASISVSFRDHPHSDRLVDKYRTERSYNPEEQGTFWTKWRARNPYYMQRPITLTTGYLKDGAIVDPITRDFVITGFTGPDSSGNVTIKGKDVLTLAEDEKAQAPVASSGKLDADITAAATSATLTPSGIGDIEYPSSGFIRIGKEVMSFTRSGDTLTLTRGQFGTEADEHEADDTVQLCLRYTSEAPQDILYDLLLNYANIPAAYLDKDQWDAEALDFLPRLYTAIITEPVGVSKLISEMAQQMYFTVWWDERLGKVIMKAVRLAQEDEVYELDDDKHLIADSIGWKDLADELITQVWVYYGQIDPTDKLDQGSNYSTISITADPTAEGPDKHNLRRIKTIFSRWIDATNASAAEDLGRRILNRYGNAPREITFRVDAKDDYLWLGDYIRLTNRLRVDRFGNPVPVNLQIFEAEEASLGSEYKFTAQEFIPALIGDEGVEDPNERVIPITSDLLNVNLRTFHDALFGAPDGTETITFVVREGVTIGGDTAGGGINVPIDQRSTANDVYAAGNSEITGTDVGNVQILQRASIGSQRAIAAGAAYESLGNAAYTVIEYPISTALDTGSWPVGVTLNLVVEAGARILGQAGNGSAHHVTTGISGYAQTRAEETTYVGIPGGDGGHAMTIQYDINITNGGTISGGGGGGGCCVFRASDQDLTQIRLDGIFGGGGAGFIPSAIKENFLFNDATFVPTETFRERDASNGTQVNSGIGGLKDYSFGLLLRVLQEGGRGGSLAGSGSNGELLVEEFFSGTNTYQSGSGGQPGFAVESGANLIEWVNKGDVRGDEVV